MTLKELSNYYEENEISYKADGKNYDFRCKYLDGGKAPMVIFYDKEHFRQFKGTKIFADGTFKTRPRRIAQVAQVYTVMGKKFNKVIINFISEALEKYSLLHSD